MNLSSRNMPEVDTVIQTRRVSKTFRREAGRATAYRVLQKQLLRRSQQSGPFVALRDISFEVLRGEKIGIIGDNGSGKTTLLKVIAGIYKPDQGQVYVNGEITLLAGLGIGMVDELSVEENVFLYGAVYGLERIKLVDNLREIIEWAQLEEFVGAKLKTLSSGMRTRLAFSAARYIDKDIYLLDEALTAGDTHFQQKCAAVFEAYKTTDKTFLITTHDLGFVKTFCSKTLWLHNGQQVKFDETEHVLEQYQESNRDSF